MKKIMIVLFWLLLMSIPLMAITPTPSPTPTILPCARCTPPPPADFRLNKTPSDCAGLLTTSLTIDYLSYYAVGAATIEISYDSSVLTPESVNLAGNFGGASNIISDGVLRISGFTINPDSSGSNVPFAEILWSRSNVFMSRVLRLNLIEVTDAAGNALNFFTAHSTTVNPLLAGDVDNSGTVSIVDALKVAQCTVGICPPDFCQALADVNQDGAMTIVDALIIAQYYVGAVPSLPIN